MWQAKVVSSAACEILVASMRITNNLLFPPPPFLSYYFETSTEGMTLKLPHRKQLVVSLDVMYNNQTSISVFTFYRQSPR